MSPENQHIGSSLRGDWIICEGDTVANFKASARGRGISRDFPRGHRHWKAPFFEQSLYFASAGGPIRT